MTKRYLLDTVVPGILDNDEVTTPTLADGSVTAGKADLAGVSGPWVYPSDVLRVGTPTLPSAAVPKSYVDTAAVPPLVVLCPATVSVGDVVYLTGSYSVDKADATSSATMPVMGLVLSKPTATTATVVAVGALSGFVGLTPGARYYVDVVAGAITNSWAGFVVGNVVQSVGLALSSTTLWVNVGEMPVEL